MNVGPVSATRKAGYPLLPRGRSAKGKKVAARVAAWIAATHRKNPSPLGGEVRVRGS